jgi:hypothetical protein
VNYLVLGIIAIVLVLILMRVRSKSGAMISNGRTTKDRRSGTERRKSSIRMPFERRKDHRRMEDAAANYVASLSDTDSS